MVLLSIEQQMDLFHIIRYEIEMKLFDQSFLKPQINHPELLTHKGAFITLKKSNKLRGCIGTVESKEPLLQVLRKMAISSAFHDPRFQPLRAEEYPFIEIEISILSDPKRIENIDDIIIGSHGLIISYKGSRGLLLPQVAIDRHWDRETFLSHTCTKASLPSDMWKKGAQIEIFEAYIIDEKDLT